MTANTPLSEDQARDMASQACRSVIAALPAALAPHLKLDALLSSYLSMAEHLQCLPESGAALCAIGPVLRRGGSLAEAEAALNPAPRVVAVRVQRAPSEMPPAHTASRDLVAHLARRISEALPPGTSDANLICAALTFLCAVASTSDQNAVMASALMKAGADELLLGRSFGASQAAKPVDPSSALH